MPKDKLSFESVAGKVDFYLNLATSEEDFRKAMLLIRVAECYSGLAETIMMREMEDDD